MSRRLATVEHVIVVHDRVVPFPGIPEGEELFRVGDRLLLRRPDGTSLTTQIASFSLVHGRATIDEVHILLDLKKDDLPIGTEIWSVN